MVKLIFIFIILFLTGCSGSNLIRETIEYDYILPAPYPLTPQHKQIHVSIDDKTIKRPEPALKYETLKLSYSAIPISAQLIVYVHIQPSFLVQREPISRQIVQYDANDKGSVVYVVTNRGYIRTPFSLELVDVLNDKLIYQTQGAGNFSIDARPKPNHSQTTNELLQAFRENREQARQTLLNEIWERLKGPYLKDIQVSLAKMQFRLVSEHEDEPDFKKAFLLLKKNDKYAAKQALVIYNAAFKRYEKKEDEESKRILGYINDGLTAAAQIANDPHPQRYQK
ncbi:hypothetical protein QNI23_012145 [Bermanella sp. WJH001]|uniref:hypothetical protein n=1 Tax=Bermanella sp. WJH001 TaxID=3048005 RepID=UPI0024BE27C4|nr:hypothetical protein [Bermanella sp. WJH001]MDJ1537739.1 hypothetical protein [Bermanella sp. WJH001]